MEYIKSFNQTSEYTAYVSGVVRPNVSLVKQGKDVYFNPYIELDPRDCVGSVMLYDLENQEKIFVLEDELTIEDYPLEEYTPIGVVAIPISHDVYGTGECGIVSLKGMDCYNPNNGGDDSNIYWGGSNTNIDTLQDFSQVPLINVTLTSNEIIDVGWDAYLPTMKTLINIPNRGLGMDIMAGYNEMPSDLKKYIPSPYLEDGNRNPSYYMISNLIPSNCLSDFNGKHNTEILLSYATSQSAWKTDISINNINKEGYYPAACCTWRYHTVGTSQGDWYLPAMGELGYLAVRNNTINNSLRKINSLYGSDYSIELNDNDYYSSTEYNNEEVMLLIMSNGLISNDSKSSNGRVRAFTRFK